MHKRRIIILIIFLIIFVMSFVVFINKAFLYSGMPTHHGLTTEMIKLYNLFREPDLTPRQIELILRGSVDEDLLPRPMFHLYDPIYNRAPYGFFTARQWIVDSGLQKSAITKFASLLFNIFGKGKFEYHGDYSWTANINNYAKNKEEEAWYGLGHVLHLIEDMTVPAHSRNDHHIGGDPYEQWAGTSNQNYDWADYLYSEKYFPKHLYTISEAFDDLAKYSNKYFFSKDSILSQDYNGPKIIKEKPEDYKMISQRTYVWGEDEGGNLFRLAGVNTLESAWRESTPYIKKKVIYEIKSDDYNLHQDYWERLAPKAVVYGAGVIQLFLKDAKIESEKLSQQKQKPTFFQRAQSFVNNIFGIGSTSPPQVDSESELPVPLPQPKPSRFPVAADIVKPIEIPIKVPSNIPSGTPANSQEKGGQKQGTPEGNQGEDKGDQGEIKGDQSENQKSNYSGSGGLSWGMIEEINQQRLAAQQLPPEETSSQSEPPPPPPPSTPPPPPPPPPPTSLHLIINEIQVKENEFVELYNPTDSPIDLASYSFCYYSSNRDWNDPFRNQQFSETASISSKGYYLVGLKGYPNENGNPDADWQVYNSAQLNNNNGSVAIFPFNPEEKSIEQAKSGVIDAVAWGEVDFVKEGMSFQQELGVDKSMERKNSPPAGEAGQDSDNNNDDFEFQKIPTPTNSNNEQRIKGTIISDDTIISEDTTWTIAGSPYYIESNSNRWPIVNEGITLIIEPGVVIMPQNSNYTFLEVRGTLKAEGTNSEKIVVTSKNDFDYGGTGSASAGDWKNLIFTDTSTDSVLDYTLFRYGGSNGEAIKIEDSTVEIKNSVIENSKANGIYLKNSNSKIESVIINESQSGIVIEGEESAPEIDGCQINNNIQYAIEIKDKAAPEIKNNSFSGNLFAAVYLYGAYPDFSNNNAVNNTLNGVLVSSQTKIDQDTTWRTNMVYILESNFGQYVTINENKTLIIEPGAIIKPHSPYYTALLVNGTLKAEAASGSEIVFTSLKDDNFGGDTNNDGNTTIPADSDWKKIKFETTSTGSVLDYVFMYYGTGVPPIETLGSASVEIKDTVDYLP